MRGDGFIILVLVNLNEDILGNSFKFINPKPLHKNTYLQMCLLQQESRGTTQKHSILYCFFNNLILELAAKHNMFKHLAHKNAVPNRYLISGSKFMLE